MTQMAAGDQVTTNVFSVLGTGWKADVSTTAISQTATMLTQPQRNVGRVILSVSTHAQAQLV